MSFGDERLSFPHHHQPDPRQLGGRRSGALDATSSRKQVPLSTLILNLLLITVAATSLIARTAEARTDNMTISGTGTGDELRIRTLTWNVGSKGPEAEDLLPALGLDQERNGSRSRLPDLLMMGWQEVPVRVSYLILEDPWIEWVQQAVRPLDYVKLKSSKMQGIMIALFARRSLVTRVREVETSFVRTGFNGMWGNKGAVAVRFTLDGCNVCLVAAHLAAHDHELDRRLHDYQDIRDGMEFKHLRSPKIFDHDHVILIGDLNFRINDLTASQIYDRITEGSDRSRQELLQKDQLNLVRKQSLPELTESAITFWPTYKFKVGSLVYDVKKRKPAFTDRVLFKDPGSGRIVQDSYRSHPQYLVSDHKPVSASFRMSLFRGSEVRRVARDTVDHKRLLDQDGTEDIVVDFGPIDRWTQDESGRAHEVAFAYRDKKSGSRSNTQAADRLSNRDWDWVAVLPHDFDSLDQWVSYAWVNESRLRTGDLVSPGSAAAAATATAATADAAVEAGAGISGEEVEDRSQRQQQGSGSGSHFLLNLDPILNPGSRYRLIYFHGETSTSVLGISDPFTVQLSADAATADHLD